MAVLLREPSGLLEPDSLSVMREYRAAYFPEGYCEDVLRKASESGPRPTLHGFCRGLKENAKRTGFVGPGVYAGM